MARCQKCSLPTPRPQDSDETRLFRINLMLFFVLVLGLYWFNIGGPTLLQHLPQTREKLVLVQRLLTDNQKKSATVLANRGGLAFASFTKPPILQRSRLTGSGNPLFESCVVGKVQQREIQVYSRITYQIPHDCTFLKRHS